MEAYFQFLAFSMETHENDPELPFILSPIYEDAGGLGEMITVVNPVFVSPTCSNGTAATEKLLLGVLGKDVTLTELLEQHGLNREMVETMVHKNLNSARVCNQANRYGQCKMQVGTGACGSSSIGRCNDGDDCGCIVMVMMDYGA